MTETTNDATPSEDLLAEADRRVNEAQRRAAALVRAKLGPGPRERETETDPFAEGADLPDSPVTPSRPL